MAPTRNNRPLKVMTWGKASFGLALAVIFDATRLFFEMFWFFGPVLAGYFCASETGADFICSAAATAAGVAFYSPLLAFGVVSAMIVGLAGWISVWTFLFISNPRIFKENASALLRMIFTGALIEIPFIGSLPYLTYTTASLYHHEIKADKKRLKEWKASEAGQRYQQALARLERQRAAREAAERAQQEEEARRAAEEETAEEEEAEAQEAEQAATEARENAAGAAAARDEAREARRLERRRPYQLIRSEGQVPTEPPKPWAEENTTDIRPSYMNETVLERARRLRAGRRINVNETSGERAEREQKSRSTTHEKSPTDERLAA